MHMDDTQATEDEATESNGRNQRIKQLEKRNQQLAEKVEKLTEKVDQQTGTGDLPITRRQTLTGLLGGSAVLGAAGTASADPPSGSGGPPFADEAHDHSGDYLGKDKPVDRIDVETLNAESGPANIRWAAPGEVQTKLDAARDDDGGVVRLVSGKVYDPVETWHIWDEVTLDYNGARVELTSDINLHRFYPRGQVINQDVDLRGVGGYSSAVNWALNAEDIPGVIPISDFDNGDARPWEKFPEGKRLINIDGGRIVGNWEKGTGIFLENRIPQGLHFFHANLAMRKIDTGVRFYRHRNGFQINGCLFNLHMDSYSIGIHQQYNPNYNTSLEYPPENTTINLDYTLINGNQFNLSTQTGLILDKPTRWLWKIEEGAKNVLTPAPQNYDLGVYTDSNNDGHSEGWLIEENFSDNNVSSRNNANILIDNRSLSDSFVIDETAESGPGGPTNGVLSWFDLMEPNQPE
jgi:hypothetical protein